MREENWIDTNEKQLAEISDAIWKLAETGLEEYHSSKILADFLENQGFSVKRGVAGMETAFVAAWGTEGPGIGFLAEYDALPGLSQKVSDRKEPEEQNSFAGHGCGHNALGTAVAGGAVETVRKIQEKGWKGRVYVFGCPAEELLVGKVKMADAGLFGCCDILLSCHPNDVNYVWARTSNAVWSGKFLFHGITAHAAIDPYNGRSALDAVEIMNVGANYLREHVTTDARIHYVITQGGQVPNVVPETAEVWYTIRAKNSEQVGQLKERVEKLAEGASVMTETTWEESTVSSCRDVLRNPFLEQLLLKAMKETGAPSWTDQEYQFAEAISKNLELSRVENAMREYGLGEKDVRSGLHTGIYDGFYREGGVMAVSTDVGDASWQVPTGVFSFASAVIGSPGHSWYYTACSGSSIAHKGICMAARVLSRTAAELLEQPELIEKAKEDFLREKRKRTGCRA